MATTDYVAECPDCGAVRRRTDSASLDTEGHRIRLRQCLGCDAYFTTVEVAIPFSYSAANALKREYRKAKTPPRRTPDFFDVKYPEKGTTDRGFEVLVRLVRG